MRNRFTDGKWHIAPGYADFLRFPINCLIKADDVTQRELVENSDIWRARRAIPATWVTASGTRYECELVLYKHPTGASDVTIGAISYDSNGIATYTPSKEGYALDTSGNLIDNSDTNASFAGVLLTDYFKVETDNVSQHENFREVTIEEGDILWLVRRGEWEVYFDGAATAGRRLMGSSTAGQFAMSADFNTGGTIGQYHTSVLENVAGQPNSKCFGVVAETIAAAGLADVQLHPAPIYAS